MTKPDAVALARAVLRVLCREFRGLRPSLGPDAPHLWRQFGWSTTTKEMGQATDFAGMLEAQGEMMGDALAKDVKRRRGSPHRWLKPREDPVPDGYQVVATALLQMDLESAASHDTHAIAVRARQIVSGDVHRFEVSIECH